MPIIKSSNIITETPVLDMDQFLRTGVIRDDQFAICDGVNRIKQLQFEVSAMADNSTAKLVAQSGTSGSFNLPSTAGGNLGLIGVGALQYSAPVTSDSVTVAATTTILVIEPAGTIAALTVTLPTTPVDGYTVRFSTTQTITTLTLAGGGSDTIVNTVTTLLANTFAAYVYRASTTKWYRI